LGENFAGMEMVVTQATLRLRSEPECERVIRLSHRRGIASAMAYRGPEDGRTPIFVLIIDEARNIERFLPELQGDRTGARLPLSPTPHAPMSSIC
jgi:acetolactate synthase regulatory subunit